MSHPTHQQSGAGDTAVPAPCRRPNVLRDTGAALLVILGLLLPWNIYFGAGIAGTLGWMFVVLVAVTLLSLAALAISYVGSASIRSPNHDPDRLTRLRLALNIPYLVVVSGFLVFAVVQSIRYGGTVAAPPGIGPGAWAGTAGAVLAAQPVITAATGSTPAYGARVCRIIGIVSIALATLAVGFNLYWRVRYVLPNLGDPDTGTQYSVVAVAAVFYGVVALVPVAIAARWIMSVNRKSRLATVLLGTSGLVAGIVVWVVPVGRELDAFHGIAQTTSTAGVGFEGYLAWTAAAALIATTTVIGAFNRDVDGSWWAAVRKCLLLIAVWCGGTTVLRIIDLAMASVLDLPVPPYNSTTLMAFDLATALLAVWLLLNSRNRAAPRLLWVLFGGLFVLTVARAVLGVALVPRARPLIATEVNDVYGNTLSHQVTSTFDVALCVLALGVLVIVVVLGTNVGKKAPTRSEPSPPVTSVPPSAPEQFAPGAGGTAGLGGPIAAAPATPISAPEPAQPAVAPAPDRIAEVLAQSTQRFAAGTTYGGGPPAPGDEERA